MFCALVVCVVLASVSVSVCDSVAELLFLLHWMQLDVLLLVMSVEIVVALIGESLPVDVLLLMPV